jgi:hypothetical protein
MKTEVLFRRAVEHVSYGRIPTEIQLFPRRAVHWLHVNVKWNRDIRMMKYNENVKGTMK